MFYFARVDATDDEFDPSFAINDFERFAESDGRRIGSVLSFDLSGNEGDFDLLELVVANPLEGLLAGPLYLWFARDNGTDIEPVFFGRLVGIPTDVTGNRVTLQYTARPRDLNAQKAALAESMRVLPYYDPYLLDEARREEADAVLEGYSGLWTFDRLTHEVGYSDYLIGEDGVEEFFASDMLSRGLSRSFGEIPLTSVTVVATIPWVQRATGAVDLSRYIVENWPNESESNSYITSFSLTAADWPKQGTGLNGGWVVQDGTCIPVYDLNVFSKAGGGKVTVNWGNWGGGTSTSETQTNDQYVKTVPPGSIDLRAVTTEDSSDISRDQPDAAAGESSGEITSFSRMLSYSDGFIPLHYSRPTLVAGFEAERARSEVIRFTLTADVQAVMTDPGDDEAMLIELNAADVSEALDPDGDTDGGFVAAIGDPRRRSYITTQRGELTLQHLICLARSVLIKRSRCARITFEPKDHLRMGDITLRKNAIIHDPRIPSGEATGKIISYRYAVDGSAGRPECSVTIACAVGRGGEIEALDGEPDYVDDDYIGPEADYQEFIGRRIVFDSGVGYVQPLFDPNDDGLDLLSALSAEDVIDEGLVVENSPAMQRALLAALLASGWNRSIRPINIPTSALLVSEDQQEVAQQLLRDREEAIRKKLEDNPTRATFRLKSMTASFNTDVDVTVTELKIPTMIDLSTA